MTLPLLIAQRGRGRLDVAKLPAIIVIVTLGGGVVDFPCAGSRVVFAAEARSEVQTFFECLSCAYESRSPERVKSFYVLVEGQAKSRIDVLPQVESAKFKVTLRNGENTEARGPMPHYDEHLGLVFESRAALRASNIVVPKISRPLRELFAGYQVNLYRLCHDPLIVSGGELKFAGNNQCRRPLWDQFLALFRRGDVSCGQAEQRCSAR